MPRMIYDFLQIMDHSRGIQFFWIPRFPKYGSNAISGECALRVTRGVLLLPSGEGWVEG